MSCSSQIPPMNIAATKEKCSGDCSYTFDYGPSSSCVVAIKENYLDITLDGTAVVTFKGIPMGVAGARIYQPSLHLFGGQPADAELIVQHTGGGQTLLVCIPITSGSSPSSFFQFIPFISGSETDNQSIPVSNWSLNSVVKQGAYYFYIGPTPYQPCTGQNNIIVFDVASGGAIMSPTDMKTLKALIKQSGTSAGDLVAATATTPVLLYNSGGSTLGTASAATSETLTCSIVQAGKPSTIPALDTGNPWTSPTMIFLYVVAALGVIAGFYALFTWLFRKGGTGGGGGGSGGSGAKTSGSGSSGRSKAGGTKMNLRRASSISDRGDDLLSVDDY